MKLGMESPHDGFRTVASALSLHTLHSAVCEIAINMTPKFSVKYFVTDDNTHGIVQVI